MIWLIIRKYDNLYIVKLYKDKLNDIDIYDMDNISNLFREVLVKLKEKYGVRGYCFIEVFVNDYYGMIIEIDNKDIYGDEIDIKIRFHIDTLFMNEIYNDEIDKYDDCYLYKNKYYLDKIISNIQHSLIEHYF